MSRSPTISTLNQVGSPSGPYPSAKTFSPTAKSPVSHSSSAADCDSNTWTTRAASRADFNCSPLWKGNSLDVFQVPVSDGTGKRQEGCEGMETRERHHSRGISRDRTPRLAHYTSHQEAPSCRHRAHHNKMSSASGPRANLRVYRHGAITHHMLVYQTIGSTAIDST